MVINCRNNSDILFLLKDSDILFILQLSYWYVSIRPLWTLFLNGGVFIYLHCHKEHSNNFAGMNFRKRPDVYEFKSINFREQRKNSQNHVSFYPQKFLPIQYAPFMKLPGKYSSEAWFVYINFAWFHHFLPKTNSMLIIYS